MKYTRVRYKLINGVYTSPPFLGGEDVYIATINPSNNELCVSRLKGSEDVVVIRETYKDIGTAKRIIKVQLKRLGVSFLDELRRKGE